MNRKIEVGCLVMIHSLTRDIEDNGKSGVVIKKVSAGESLGIVSGMQAYSAGGGWLVESPRLRYGMNVFKEHNLLRIDDHSEETETQEEEMVA